MKRACNPGDVGQHPGLVSVIACADASAKGNGCQHGPRPTSSFRHADGLASRADAASRIDPRVIVGIRHVLCRRLRSGAIVPRRFARRRHRIHALRQHDRNAIGQRVRRFLPRRCESGAVLDSARHGGRRVRAARGDFGNLKIPGNCERRAALIASFDGDMIHRLAFRARFEIQRRAAFVAEFRSCWIAVVTEVTACGHGHRCCATAGIREGAVAAVPLTRSREAYRSPAGARPIAAPRRRALPAFDRRLAAVWPRPTHPPSTACARR